MQPRPRTGGKESEPQWRQSTLKKVCSLCRISRLNLYWHLGSGYSVYGLSPNPCCRQCHCQWLCITVSLSVYNGSCSENSGITAVVCWNLGLAETREISIRGRRAERSRCAAVVLPSIPRTRSTLIHLISCPFHRQFRAKMLHSTSTRPAVIKRKQDASCLSTGMFPGKCFCSKACAVTFPTSACCISCAVRSRLCRACPL